MLRLTRVHFAILALAIVWLGITQGAALSSGGPRKAPPAQLVPTPAPTRTPQRLATLPRIVTVGTIVTFVLSPTDGDTSVPIDFGDGDSGTLLPVFGAPALEAKHAYGASSLRGYEACLNRPTLPVIVAPDLCTRIVVQDPAPTPVPTPTATPTPLPPPALTAVPNGVPAGTAIAFSFGPVSARITSRAIVFDDGTSGSITGAPANAAFTTLTTSHAFSSGRAEPYHVCVVSATGAEDVAALAPACVNVFVRPGTSVSPSPSFAPSAAPATSATPSPSPTPTRTPTTSPTPTSVPTATSTPTLAPTTAASPSPTPARTPTKGTIAPPRPSAPFANAYVTVAFPSGLQEILVPYGTIAPGPIAQIVSASNGRVTLQWSIDGLVVSTLNFNVVAGSITPVTYPGLLPVGGNHTLVAALVPNAYPLATPDPRAFVHYAYGSTGGVAPSDVTALPSGVGDHDLFFAVGDGHGRISLFWYPEVSRLTVPAFRLTEIYAGKERALLASITPGDVRIQNAVSKADLAAVGNLSTDFATARATGKTRDLSQLLATKVFADFAFAQAAGFARSIVAYDVGPRAYRIVELDAAGAPTGVSIDSNVVDPAVASDGVLAIAGLTGAVSGREVDLGWSPPSANDSPYAFAYDIVRAAGGVTLDLTPVPQLLGATWSAPPQFVDSNPPSGTTATYTVRAIDVFGRRGNPASVTVEVPVFR